MCSTGSQELPVKIKAVEMNAKVQDTNIFKISIIDFKYHTTGCVNNFNKP